MRATSTIPQRRCLRTRFARRRSLGKCSDGQLVWSRKRRAFAPCGHGGSQCARCSLWIREMFSSPRRWSINNRTGRAPASDRTCKIITRKSTRRWRPRTLIGTLHQRDTDACCALRKTRPLQKALRDYDGWITGRKRFQAGTRAALEFFEVEDFTGRIKVNPLAHWAPEDVQRLYGRKPPAANTR